MDFLKKLPITYKGELHNIRLVNFFVPMEEVRPLLPPQIKIRNFDGKAMISMVDVTLKQMHSTNMPFFKFGYRHVAFRLLVDDAHLNNGKCKGIYFLKSFTNKFQIALGGKIFTDYNLSKASIQDKLDSVVIGQNKQTVVYQRNDKSTVMDDAMPELINVIGAIDRAYSVVNNKIKVTLIQREKWPLEPVTCAFFKNSFFKETEFLGVFSVKEVIHYTWLPAKVVEVEEKGVQMFLRNKYLDIA